ncbi:MAG: hypothetical protein ACOVN2_09280, partial [Usitatibacteraceae bacterium]
RDRRREPVEAIVPADRAEACVASLRGIGYVDTAVIGRILPQSDALEPITLNAGLLGLLV